LTRENHNIRDREIQRQLLALAFDNWNLINCKNCNTNQAIANNFIHETIPSGTPIQNPVPTAFI
jgi:hypothetical protein